MSGPLLDPANLAIARRAREEADLCDRCLGRLVWRSEGGGNLARGEGLRKELGLAEVQGSACDVCGGLFEEAPHLAELVVEALEPVEFETFLLGSRVDRDIEAAEAELWDVLELDDTEAAHSELNRLVGKIVSEAIEKPVAFKRPDVTAVVDARFDIVELDISPVFVYGRYRKLEAGIPQTHWPCRRCRGTGCVECDGTGKRYLTSVEELVAAPFVEASGAADESFHGAGREDVDARCLGTGRPFVLELKDPTRRVLDLESLGEAVAEGSGHRVEVTDLRPAKRAWIADLKAARSAKAYLATVALGEAVTEEKLMNVVGVLAGCAVAQRTPSRVSHRRADKVRERRVHAIAVERHTGDEVALRIEGDAGLYIKELVSGDGGRTRPSLAELLGVPAEVTALDVVEVAYEPPDDPQKEE